MNASTAFINPAGLRTTSCYFSTTSSKLCLYPTKPRTFKTVHASMHDPHSKGHPSKSSWPSSPTEITTLPTAEELASETFPTTVMLAGAVLRMSKMSRPDLLSALFSTSDGARGLFVAFLADGSLPLEELDPADPVMVDTVVNTPGADVREFAVKNVVMPTAKLVHYDRAGETERAAASRLTKDRAQRLLTAWVAKEDSDPVKRDDSIRKIVGDMIDAISGNGGPQTTFVKKYNYDDEQKAAMLETLQNSLNDN